MKAEKTVTPMVERRMPEAVRLGENLNFTIGFALHHRDKYLEDPAKANTAGHRIVMGFALPEWQRPIVWDMERQIRFIESAWRGVPLGTYTFNMKHGHRLHNLLIDGQQRMHALECYITDQFPVFGMKWSEVRKADKNRFDLTTAFHCFRTQSDDEAYLRSYYDLMNFGGVAHTEDQRATGGVFNNS